MSLTLTACDGSTAGRRALAAVAPRSAPRPLPTTRSLALARDRSARLRPAPGTSIECLAGRAWITLDRDPRDPRDIVLEAGEAFFVDREATLMIFAFASAAELRIREPAGARPSPSTADWRARAAYLTVVVGSVLAFVGVRCAVAGLSDLAAATSLMTAVDERGTPSGRPLPALRTAILFTHSSEGVS